ncbi:MAG: hypothetical protein HY722_01955 [Planctomycetes bacterium]|nr:hypothetical protein [Planctomycetota bacterium]
MSRTMDGTRSERGGVLIAVAMTLLVLAAAAASMTSSGAAASAALGRRSEAESAFWAAQAGLERARRALAREPGFIGDLAGQAARASYTVRVDGPGDQGPWALRATGTRGTSVRALEADYRPLRYSDYLFVVGADIGVWQDFQAEGPIHVNGDFQVHGSGAVFQDEVSATGTIDAPGDADFQGGATGGATPIPMPFPDDDIPGPLAAVAAAEGAYYEGATRITFRADGTMDVEGTGPGAVGTGIPLPPSGLIVVDDDDLGDDDAPRVSGTISGRVTVLSAEEIVIVGPIDHAHPEGDTLGLVAVEDDIVVDFEGHPSQEPQVVRAALMAPHGTLDVVGWANGLGRLAVLGSLTLGEVEGSLMSPRKVTDWIHYDRGLRTAVPPFFDGVAGRAPLLVPGTWREVAP